MRTTPIRWPSGWTTTAHPRSGSGPRSALELAGLGIDDIDLIDIYSCFPSAVQVAAAEIGISTADPARPLTVTGGLTFAGGPWNNYVMHSIATMAEKLVQAPGTRGLITANGGYLTKHCLRCVQRRAATGELPLGGRPGGRGPRTDPPGDRGLRGCRDAGDLDRARSTATAGPTRRSWRYAPRTMPAHWPSITDPDGAAALVIGEAGDPAGAKVRVDADGTATLV